MRYLGKAKHIYFCAGIFLISLLLRLYYLGNRGFWTDEIDLWQAALGKEFSIHHAPLSAWISGWFMALTHDNSSLAFHFPVAFFGALTVFAAYLIASEISNSETGLVAAVLVCFSPLSLYYSQEGRPYGLFQFLSALLIWSYLRARKNQTLSHWFIYSAVLMLSCLTHALTVQLILSFAAVEMYFLPYKAIKKKKFWSELKKDLIPFVTFTFAGAVLGMSWVIQRVFIYDSFFEVASSKFYQGSVPKFLLGILTSLGPHIYYPEHNGGNSSFYYEPVLGLMILVPFICGIVSLVKKRETLFLTVLKYTFICVLCINLFTLGDKVYWTWFRYVIHLLVPFAVTIAVGITSAGTRTILSRRGLVLLLVLFIYIPGFLSWTENARWVRSSYTKRVAEVLNRRRNAYTGVIFIADEKKEDWERDLDVFGFWKKADIPVFVLHRKKGSFQRVLWEEDQYKIGKISRMAPNIKKQIPAGVYTVVRTDVYQPNVCEKILEPSTQVDYSLKSENAAFPFIFGCRIENHN